MMKDLKNKIKNATAGEIINFSCFVVSICMLITSFFLPPMGVIDDSVLQAVAIIGIFSTISKIPDFINSIKDGKSLHVEKGDMEITIESEKDNEEDDKKN